MIIAGCFSRACMTVDFLLENWWVRFHYHDESQRENVTAKLRQGPNARFLKELSYAPWISPGSLSQHLDLIRHHYDEEEKKPMKIAVTTPTGHIGNKLANILLDRMCDVTLIARHPEKVKDLTRRGVKVIAGEHSDARVLEQAVRDTDALFWLTPPDITSHDPLGMARRMAEAGASVICRHPDLHVVQLSSAGAFLPSGTGPIVGLSDTEEKFRAAGKNVVSLRPNSFMENLFFSLPTIIGQNSIYTSIPGSVKAPYIATQDIAEVAAEFLLKPIDGHHVVDIVGPQELSLDEWARIAGQAIGRQIRVVTVPGDKLKAAMSQGGMSPEMAVLMVEMEEAYRKIQGQFKGDQKRIGKIEFSQFAREVFAPGYRKGLQASA
jgi:uncharacterized protein YbjT (DUF2867 family)